MKVGLLFGGYRKAPPDQLKLPTAPRTGPSWEERIPEQVGRRRRQPIPKQCLPMVPPTRLIPTLAFPPPISASPYISGLKGAPLTGMNTALKPSWDISSSKELLLMVCVPGERHDT